MTPWSQFDLDAARQRTEKARNPAKAAVQAEQEREKWAAGEEGKLQDAIIQYCELNGLYVLWSRRDKKTRSRKGHPDLSIWGRDKRSVLIECKAGNNHTDDDQEKCIAELRAAGAAVAVVWNLHDAIAFIRKHLDPL